MSTLSGGPNIVTDGLVLYLDAANEKSYPGSGATWVDLTKNNNNATLYNNPTYNALNKGFYTFDGINNYCDVNFNNRSTVVNSIEMFFRWRSGSGGMFMGFTSYDIYTAGGHLGFNTAASDVWGINSSRVTSLNLVGTAESNWHHYVFVFANQIQNNKIYIDGNSETLSQILATTNLTTIRSFTSTFRLSGWLNSTLYRINGDYAYVKAYNRELTATEILQNYNATKSRYNL
jgi:hypothetical protein